MRTALEEQGLRYWLLRGRDHKGSCVSVTSQDCKTHIRVIKSAKESTSKSKSHSKHKPKHTVSKLKSSFDNTQPKRETKFANPRKEALVLMVQHETKKKMPKMSSESNLLRFRKGESSKASLKTSTNKTTQLPSMIKSTHMDRRTDKTSKKILTKCTASKLRLHTDLERQLFTSEDSSRHKPIPKICTLPSEGNPEQDQSLIHSAVSTPKQSVDNLLSHQREITPRMRSILVDWLFRISSEMQLPRETTHLGISYLDAFISKVEVTKAEFQMCGISSLILAVKEQTLDNRDEIQQLLNACGQGYYSPQEIFKMEQRILVAVGFKLRVYTMAFWVDYISTKWDAFASREVTDKQLVFNSVSFRELTQLVDASVYHENSLSQNKAKLVLGAAYLVTRICHQLQSESPSSSKQQLYNTMHRQFQSRVTPIFKDKHCFNQVFNEFSVEVCGLQMHETIPEIKYLSLFLHIPLHNIPETPDSLRIQTHNPHMISYVLQS